MPNSTQGRPSSGAPVAGIDVATSTNVRVDDPPLVVELGELWLRVAAGMISLLGKDLRDVVVRSRPGSGQVDQLALIDEQATSRSDALVGTIGGTVGATLSVASAGLRMLTGAEQRLRRRVPSFLLDGGRTMARELEGWLARRTQPWQDARSSAEASARAFLDALIPAIASAILDRLDVTDLVATRVDLNRVIESIDVRPIVDRLDVDQIASRLDIEALVARLDVGAIARDVVEEIDLAGIVRESTGTLTDEAIEGVRAQGMHADRFVSKLIDRSLRRADRDTAIPAPTGPAKNGG